MKRKKIIRLITIGGFLTSITVILQGAPIYLFSIGLFLSPFSTLPVAVAAVSNIPLAIAIYFASSIILLFVSLEESIIFFFTTGLLGLMIGVLLYRRNIIFSILLSSISLMSGLIILTYLIQLDAFLSFAYELSFSYTIAIFFIFSVFYSFIWNLMILKLMKYLKGIMSDKT